MSKIKAVKSEVQPFFDNQIFWKIDDVASFTGLAKKTIYNLCSMGEMPYLKQRKRLVFIPNEIRKWNTPKGTR
jgi:predicted DNA-binding transcriptional regulator AlpA